MHPASCGEWEYTEHADAALVRKRSVDLLRRAQGSVADAEVVCADSRSAHQEIFSAVTPTGQEYLAGHYRGEAYPCLEFRPAYIARQPGFPPSDIAMAMQAYHAEVQGALADLEMATAKKKGKKLTDGEWLHLTAELLAALYVQFLVIHPYANGNGHISRLIVWVMLIRLRRFPQQWPLHSRPPTDQLIAQYRQGDTDPLARYIIKAIRGY